MKWFTVRFHPDTDIVIQELEVGIMLEQDRTRLCARHLLRTHIDGYEFMNLKDLERRITRFLCLCSYFVAKMCLSETNTPRQHSSARSTALVVLNPKKKHTSFDFHKSKPFRWIWIHVWICMLFIPWYDSDVSFFFCLSH